MNTHLDPEDEQDLTLPIVGMTVGRFILHSNLDLMFQNDHYEEVTMLRIGAAFALKSDTDTYRMNTEKLEEISPVFRVFQKTVISAYTTQHGKLSVSFSDGYILEVESDEQYEAWEMVGEKENPKFLVVCTPGGDLAIWS